MHNFAEKLAEGQAWERQLDGFFEQYYLVHPARMNDQRRGIDRFFAEPDGTVHKVEYKADSRSHETGNAFIETISVDSANKSGWAFTSQADWLVYFVPPELRGWCIKFDRLRVHLPRWIDRYPVRSALNEGYRTWGVLVPLTELQRLSEYDVSIGG